MGPARVKKVLTERLAFLTAQLESGVPPRKAAYVQDEMEALRSVLTQTGLLDEQHVEYKVSRVAESVIPAMQTVREKNRVVREGVSSLVKSIMRTAKVA